MSFKRFTYVLMCLVYLETPWDVRLISETKLNAKMESWLFDFKEIFVKENRGQCKHMKLYKSLILLTEIAELVWYCTFCHVEFLIHLFFIYFLAVTRSSRRHLVFQVQPVWSEHHLCGLHQWTGLFGSLILSSVSKFRILQVFCY